MVKNTCGKQKPQEGRLLEQRADAVAVWRGCEDRLTAGGEVRDRAQEDAYNLHER